MTCQGQRHKGGVGLGAGEDYCDSGEYCGKDYCGGELPGFCQPPPPPRWECTGIVYTSVKIYNSVSVQNQVAKFYNRYVGESTKENASGFLPKTDF